MIKVDGVKKKYKGFELDCSIEVKKGSVTALIGRNGAGKSTTFKAILGLIRLDEGRITIDGKDIKELSAKDRENVGVVLAEAGFSAELRVKDIVPIMAAMYSKFDKQDFIKKCEKFDIPMDKKLKEFSTGMKAKFKLLIAMSHGAKLLILDEPTAGLDVVVRDKLLDMLREYMEDEECSILISSHISSDLEGLCDDVYLIEDGKILLHESIDMLMDEYGVLKVTKEQYDKLDKSCVLRTKQESYGYRVLSDNKQFYSENYPDITIEKCNLDQALTIMATGKEV